jgi:hypothetical protein
MGNEQYGEEHDAPETDNEEGDMELICKKSRLLLADWLYSVMH